MTLYVRGTQGVPSSHSPRGAIKRLFPYTNRLLARISPAVRPLELYDVRRHARNDARHRAVLTAISVLLGTGILLSGCAAARNHDSAAVYESDGPVSGPLDLAFWGWHSCDCGIFGQTERTEPDD